MTEKKAKTVGRPSTYTKKLGDTICARIATGESLRAICKEEGMPALSTIMLWVVDTNHKVFSEQYAQACNARAEHLFEEILEISDASDEVVKKGAEKKSSAYSSNQRLKVDSRKWYLSKVLPKKFGDKVDITSDNKPLPLLHVLHNNLNTENKVTAQENSSSAGGNIGKQDNRDTPKSN